MLKRVAVAVSYFLLLLVLTLGCFGYLTWAIVAEASVSFAAGEWGEGSICLLCAVWPAFLTFGFLIELRGEEKAIMHVQGVR